MLNHVINDSNLRSLTCDVMSTLFGGSFAGCSCLFLVCAVQQHLTMTRLLTAARVFHSLLLTVSHCLPSTKTQAGNTIHGKNYEVVVFVKDVPVGDSIAVGPR